jgi:hypothetical protein
VENKDGNQDAKGNAVDAAHAFLVGVVPNSNPDKSTGCASAPDLKTAELRGSTGIDDTFVDVLPGTRICFDVLTKQNNTVEPAVSLQLFRARIDIWGDNSTILDSREVWFVVPPKPPEPDDPVVI